MSRNDVYEQLTSDAGENFTKEEADYAVAHMDDPDNAENFRRNQLSNKGRIFRKRKCGLLLYLED